jgi:hypothetical protein
VEQARQLQRRTRFEGAALPLGAHSFRLDGPIDAWNREKATRDSQKKNGGMKVLVTALVFVTTISGVTASQREEGEISGLYQVSHCGLCWIFL